MPRNLQLPAALAVSLILLLAKMSWRHPNEAVSFHGSPQCLHGDRKLNGGAPSRMAREPSPCGAAPLAEMTPLPPGSIMALALIRKSFWVSHLLAVFSLSFSMCYY